MLAAEEGHISAALPAVEGRTIAGLPVEEGHTLAAWEQRMLERTPLVEEGAHLVLCLFEVDMVRDTQHWVADTHQGRPL
jgi:hypothetical protein